MSKKGKSAAEKKQILLKIIRKNQQFGPFFNLKEIEKLGSKEGVVEKSIKDIIAELVEDGEIEQEKIGASQYFFSFPNTILLSKKRKLESMETELKSLQENVESMQDQIKMAIEERPDVIDDQVLSELNTEFNVMRLLRDVAESEWMDDGDKKVVNTVIESEKGNVFCSQRQAWVRLWNMLSKKEQECKIALRTAGLADPQTVEKLKKETVDAKEASNRWTDNIFMLQKYLQNSIGMDTQMFSDHFGIPIDLDYDF